MNTIDPDIDRFVSAMREDWSRFPPLSSMSFAELRAAAETVRHRWTLGGPSMAETLDLTLDPGGGELRIRVHRPPAAGEMPGALVYLHGGGFTLLSIDTHDRLMREYAAAGQFAVIGVDYPLAPECRYPLALDRIEALMCWLGDHAERWRVDPDRLAIGGDSAGGNLAFAACLRLRDRSRLGLVRAILSSYGGFSPEISDDAEHRFGGPGSIMDREEARQYWKNYLRDEKDASDPYACPLLADVTGFPPVFLAVPELDLVAEHSLAMEKRLRSAGVLVERVTYPGAVHSFLEAVSISALAQRAIADGARFVSRHIGYGG